MSNGLSMGNILVFLVNVYVVSRVCPYAKAIFSLAKKLPPI